MWHEPQYDNVEIKTCPVCGRQQPATIDKCECGYEFDPATRVGRLFRDPHIWRALKMLATHPMLWLYALIVLVAGSVGGFVANTIFFVAFRVNFDTSWLGIIGILLVILPVVIIQQFGQSAIIYAVARYERRGTTDGDSVLRAAWRSLPRMVLLGLLLAMTWVPLLRRDLGGTDNLEGVIRTTTCGISLLLGMAVSLVAGIAQQLCIHQKMGVASSLRNAVQIAMQHIGQVLGIAIILYLVGVVLTFVLAIPARFVDSGIVQALLSLLSVTTWTLFYLDLEWLGFVSTKEKI